jgi:hypothetical protein
MSTARQETMRWRRIARMANAKTIAANNALRHIRSGMLNAADTQREAIRSMNSALDRAGQSLNWGKP